MHVFDNESRNVDTTAVVTSTSGCISSGGELGGMQTFESGGSGGRGGGGGTSE